MTENTPALTPDDKLVQTMIYTPQKLIWGQLVSKQAIRVSTWLQTDMAPDYFFMKDAQTLLVSPGQNIPPIKSQKLHIHTQQIIAYHVLPPVDESPFYDPNEPNRRMAAATASVGWFQFDCFVRLAELSEMATFLGAQKGEFFPIFDAAMHCPVLPAIKGIKTPFALVRQSEVTFAEK